MLGIRVCLEFKGQDDQFLRNGEGPNVGNVKKRRARETAEHTHRAPLDAA